MSARLLTKMRSGKRKREMNKNEKRDTILLFFFKMYKLVGVGRQTSMMTRIYLKKYRTWVSRNRFPIDDYWSTL
jgi:hypothetical protein